MRVLILFTLLMTSFNAYTAELRVGNRYIANATFTAQIADLVPVQPQVIARETVLQIVKIEGDIVTFDVTETVNITDKKEKKLLWDSLFEVNIKKLDLRIYIRDWDTVGHGVLVVPFKISFGDGSLSTKSVSLGYYLQAPRWRTSGGVAHGPIWSAGLTSITRDESENTELGATLAAGYVWSIQDKFQLGVVVGIDHLGDDTWEYEDDGWISMMIGFNFLQ